MERKKQHAKARESKIAEDRVRYSKRKQVGSKRKQERTRESKRVI